MPPYNPPNTFYREIQGIEDKTIMFKIVGKNGKHFKYLTETLGIDYLWWDIKRNVIEVWGPHKKLVSASEMIVNWMIQQKGSFMTNKEYALMDSAACAF